eukprot:1405571-Pleurochrysis_carterae.AAC.1
MPADVFRTLIVLRVVCKVNRRFVVHGESSRLLGGQAEIGEERAQIDSFFGCFGGRDDFRFARGQRDR